MNYEIFSLFPIPVLRVKNFITEDERFDLLKRIDCIKHEEHPTLIGDTVSSHNIKNNLLENSLVDKLQDPLDYYCKVNGLAKVKITNSWSNIQNKNSRLLDHRHPESKISGALYINVSMNSSNLYFLNPNPFNEFVDYIEETEYNFSYVRIEPENCQLILFPSWLKHGSHEETNNMDNRIVVSFNAS